MGQGKTSRAGARRGARVYQRSLFKKRNREGTSSNCSRRTKKARQQQQQQRQQQQRQHLTHGQEFSASRSSNTAAAANGATAANAAATAANAAAAAAANTKQQCSSSKGSRYEILIAHNAAHRGRTGEGQGGGSNGRIWAGRGSSAITKQVGRINSK